MEASGAPAAAAEAQEPGTEQQGQAQQQQGSPDLSQLNELVQGIPQVQGELRDMIRGLQPQEEEPEPASLDLSDLYEEALGPDPDELASKFSDYTDRRIEEALKPYEERTKAAEDRAAQVERAQQMKTLVEEMPEMDDPETAKEVMDLTQQYADMLGGQYSELGSDPRFMKVIAYAARAIQAAQEEGAETPNAAHLESGSSARPGLSGDEAEQVFSPDTMGRRVVGW